MKTVILGIESSCDETAASMVLDGKVQSNIIASQMVHANYGGVVPELASRAHQQNIFQVVRRALEEAKIDMLHISAIAFTQGPGLLGSLLVGESFAKGLALSLGIPIIPVHHMKAHILSHFIEEPFPTFPFLCLTVSGGHTQIVKVNDYLQMEVLGETLDDAAGEAFDKAAKILGLPYPGGPEIDQLAATGDPYAFSFPRSEVPGLDYSFSGIKTAFLYFLRDRVQVNSNFVEENLPDITASIQHAVIEMLMEKLLLASKQTGIRQVAIAGGVSANSGLRKELEDVAARQDWITYIPKMEYCTDNAAMIAVTGHFMAEAGHFGDMTTQSMARMPFPV